MTGKTLQELYFRRSLARQFIKLLDEMPASELEALGVTEETRKNAMDEYKRQLSVIDAEIAEIEGTPPPVVVGLKTAKLFGISENTRR